MDRDLLKRTIKIPKDASLSKLQYQEFMNLIYDLGQIQMVFFCIRVPVFSFCFPNVHAYCHTFNSGFQIFLNSLPCSI